MKYSYLCMALLMGGALVSSEVLASDCPNEIERKKLAPMRKDKNAQIEINGKKYKLHNPDADQKSVPTYDPKVLKVNMSVKLDQAKTSQNPGLCVYTYRQWGKIITKPMFTFTLEEVKNQPTRQRGRTIQPMNPNTLPSQDMPPMFGEESPKVENRGPMMEPTPSIIPPPELSPMFGEESANKENMEPFPMMQDEPMVEKNPVVQPPKGFVPPPPPPMPTKSDKPNVKPSQGMVPPPPPPMPPSMMTPPPSPEANPLSSSSGLNSSGEQSGSLSDELNKPRKLKDSKERVLKDKPVNPLSVQEQMHQSLVEAMESRRPDIAGVDDNDPEEEDDGYWD